MVSRAAATFSPSIVPAFFIAAASSITESYVCAAHAKVVIVGKFFRTRSPSDFVRALLSSVVEAAMMMCSASFWPAMRGISELRLPHVPSVVGR